MLGVFFSFFFFSGSKPRVGSCFSEIEKNSVVDDYFGVGFLLFDIFVLVYFVCVPMLVFGYPCFEFICKYCVLVLDNLYLKCYLLPSCLPVCFFNLWLYLELIH